MKTIASLNKGLRIRSKGSSQIGQLRVIAGPKMRVGRTVGKRIGKLRFGR